MTSIPFVILTAFTDSISGGNPAAVVFPPPSLGSTLTDEVCMVISRNFNQPMAAFVVPRAPSANPHEKDIASFDVRFFVAEREIPMCGHATLCTAKTLFENHLGHNLVSPSVTTLRFNTRTGSVFVARKVEEGKIEIALDAAQMEEMKEGAEDTVRVSKAFKNAFNGQANPMHIARGLGPYATYVLVELDTPDLGALTVDVPALRDSGFNIHVLTTASRTPDAAFESRMFAPFITIPEDAVCGTAHALLVPFWTAKNHLENAVASKEGIRAHQVSTRGGWLRVRTEEGGKTIRLAGDVTLIAKGEVFV